MNPKGKPEGLRQAMSWFHTWAGLLLGWVMFAIFVTGSLSYYRQELTLWLRPELQTLAPPAPGVERIALERLQTLAPEAGFWSLRLPDERDPALRIGWREAGGAGGRPRVENRVLDPASGELLPVRAGMAGDFPYRFHFELRSAQRSQWILEGRWAVCIATAVMFAALLSGIVTHRRIFADFFTFRPAKGGQRAWLDGHNVSAVLVLPFYLLITFSGLLLFQTIFMPAGIAAAYGEQSRAYLDELRGASPGVKRHGAPDAAAGSGPMPALAWDTVLAESRRQLPDGRIDVILVRRDGPAVHVEVRGSDAKRLAYPPVELAFDGRSGLLLGRVDPQGAAARTVGTIYGLHLAHFASPGLRFVLFGFGLLGSLMIGSGLALWVVKRRERGKTPALALHLVDGLNIGTLAGLPLALAVFALGSLWLPAGLAERGEAEIRCFFAAWGLALVWGLARPGRATWGRQWGCVAVACAALLASGLWVAATNGAAPRPLTVWAVDAAWLIAALAAAALAWRLRASATGRPARPALRAGEVA